jgi:hypothetical protein
MLKRRDKIFLARLLFACLVLAGITYWIEELREAGCIGSASVTSGNARVSAFSANIRAFLVREALRGDVCRALTNT